MPTIPTYPPPSGPLDGTELLLGFADGVTRRISSADLLAYIIASPTMQLLLAQTVGNIVQGQTAFQLPNEANGDAKPAAGSGLPYLSGDGVFKIA